MKDKHLTPTYNLSKIPHEELEKIKGSILDYYVRHILKEVTNEKKYNRREEEVHDG